MIQRIKTYFSSISKVCVLEQITFDDKTLYSYIEVSLVKEELTFKNQQSFSNISEFKKLNSRSRLASTSNEYLILAKV